MSNFYVSGYATITRTDSHNVVCYGLFNTRVEAEAWGKQLINCEVVAINAPMFSEGGRGE